MELTTKDWKEFRIGDLFSVETCKGVDAGSLCLNKNYSENTPYEFIGRTNDNYGLQGYIGDLGFPVNNSETITISQVGTIVAQIRTSKYYTSQNIFKLTALKFEPNQWNLLFIVTMLNKILLRYTGYASYPTQKSLKKETLLLPSKNDEPDWDFMEEFIKGIEEKYIENVDEYNQENIDKALSVTGLTTADLNGNLEVKPADRYEEFRVGDLFNIETSPSFDMVNIDISNKINDDYKYEFIIRSKDNYGVKGYVKHLGIEPNEKNKITISQVGTIVAQYRTNDYYTSQNIFNLSPKFDLTENKVLFFVSSLNCVLKKYSGYSDYPTLKSLKNEKILLPAIDENTPDFDYMEKAIYIYILKRSLSLGKWITKKKSEL